MREKEPAPNDTKVVFWKCGTCSHTFYYLLNREFGNHDENKERAVDLLAGGIMNRGYQCGMLWGSVMASGAEAFRRYGDCDQAINASVNAAQNVMDSFKRATNTYDCRDVVHCNLSKISGMLKMMFDVISKGFMNSRCFNIAEKWTDNAFKAARSGLSVASGEKSNKLTICTSELLKKMGATNEESITVAGLAGGMGLSGNGCGALAAAIWFKLLQWCRKNPGKNPSYFNNKIANTIMKKFLAASSDEFLCRKICSKSFATVQEHSDYVKNGGCGSILDVLASLQ